MVEIAALKAELGHCCHLLCIIALHCILIDELVSDGVAVGVVVKRSPVAGQDRLSTPTSAHQTLLLYL